MSDIEKSHEGSAAHGVATGGGGCMILCKHAAARP